MRLSQSRLQQPDSQAKHLRETRRQILFPLLAATLLVVVSIMVVLILPRRAQVSVVADIMLITLMLCPAAVCLLPLTIGLLVVAFRAGQLHSQLAPPLRGWQARTAALSARAAALADAVNRRVIVYSARLEVVLRALDAFEDKQPTTSTLSEETDE